MSFLFAAEIRPVLLGPTSSHFTICISEAIGDELMKLFGHMHHYCGYIGPQFCFFALYSFPVRLKFA